MPFTISIFSGDPLCAESCTGTITAIADPPSILPVTFTLTPGGLTGTDTTGNGVNFSGLCAGDYIITATDSTPDTGSVAVNLALANPISFGVDVDGTTITINAVGGNGTYEYRLDSGAYQASNIFMGVGVGGHTITVRDGLGCITTESVGIEPPATTGFINSNINIYQNPGQNYSNSCIGPLVPGMRVQVSIDMSIPGYNVEIINNDAAGTFDTNFVGLGTILTDTLPADLDNYLLSNDTPITLEADNSGATTVFRIPEDWTGINYLIYVYVFNITLPSGFSYTDRIYHRTIIDVKPIDDGTDFTPELQDADGAALDSICDNPTDSVFRVAFPTTTLAGDFDAHYLLIQDGEVLEEEDPFNNNNMERLFSEILRDAEPLLTAPGTIKVDVNGNFLPVGDYCIRGIFIENTNPAPTMCDCFDLELTRTIGTFTGSGIAPSSLAYNLVGLTDAEVDTVQLRLDILPGLLGSVSNAAGTFFYQAEDIPTSDVVSGQIVLANGCSYEIEPITFPPRVTGVETATIELGSCCAVLELVESNNNGVTVDITATFTSGTCVTPLYFWFGAGPIGDQTITVNVGQTINSSVTCTAQESCVYTASITV